MTTTTPTILFVHGAWHSPDLHYNKLQRALKAAGFNLKCPKMPSASGDRPPTITLDDDIAAIRLEAMQLVEHGQPVLVLAHSYGGIVATSAISEDLTWSSRKKAGKEGGVLQTVYFCAFLPRIGGGVANLWEGSGATLHFDVSDDGVAFPSNPFEAFYRDVEKTDAEKYKSHLHVQPAATFVAGATGEAWRFMPITYIYCTQDEAIPYTLQQKLVAAAKDAGALDLHTEVLESSHSPHANRQLTPLVGLVKEAWNKSAVQCGCSRLA